MKKSDHISVKMTPEQTQKIRAISQATGQNSSAVLRLLVDRAFVIHSTPQQQPAPTSATQGKHGR